MKKLFQKRMVDGVWIPSLVFAVYLLIEGICGSVFSNIYVGTVIFDVVVLAVFGFMYYMEWRDSVRLSGDENVKFSVFGWVVLLIVFAGVYISAEALGQHIMYHTVQDVSLYTDTENPMFWLYLVDAVTIGPVCEELVFRWFIFGRNRTVLPFWASFLFSTVLFSFAHMSWMHVPVTVLLSFFICVMYETTHKFRYCVGFHLLFNYMAATYVFTLVNFPLWSIILAYVIVAVLIACGYVFREKLFKTVLRKGSLEKFESYLDRTRMEFGKNSTEDEKKS